MPSKSYRLTSSPHHWSSFVHSYSPRLLLLWLTFHSQSRQDKSDSIILDTHQRLRTFPAIQAVKISGIDINISNKITSLCVPMDSKLTLGSHISAICKSCYYHLRSLRHIRRSLTQDMAISVAVAIVQSRLDYCNSLFYDISTFNISKLQRVQNLTARLALNDWHSPSHILVSKLHWQQIIHSNSLHSWIITKKKCFQTRFKSV